MTEPYIYFNEMPHFKGADELLAQIEDGVSDDTRALYTEMIQCVAAYDNGEESRFSGGEGLRWIIADDDSQIVGFALVNLHNIEAMREKLEFSVLRNEPLNPGEILAVHARADLRVRTDLLETLFTKVDLLLRLHEVHARARHLIPTNSTGVDDCDAR